MARPIKDGIDYFSLDVHMDSKIKLVEAKFGIQGFGILIKLYQRIYSEGYYLKWTEDEQLLFAHENNIDDELLHTLIEFLLAKNIFNKDLFQQFCILTSSGIQKRYIQGTQRRKEVNFIKEYLLVDITSKTYPSKVNVNINRVNADINTTKTELMNNNNPQSKVKYSKVKESKVVVVNNNSDNNQDSEVQPASKTTTTKNIYEFYETNMGQPINAVISEKLDDWVNRLGVELVQHAIEQSVIHGGYSYAYLEKILLSYSAKGYKKKEQVIIAEGKRKSSIENKASTTKNKFNNYEQRDYDFAEIERKAFQKMFQERKEG